MAFILLVALSALFVAGCAAFFSIKGLIVLFSGSALAIGVMASSLEIGKLVAASFLHAQWKRLSWILKTYLCLAVFVLMCITSLGIFGFLTGAYQIHSAKVSTFDTKINTLMHEKSAVDQAVLEYSNRIKSLVEVRAVQEQRVQTAGNYKAPRDQAYKAISEANDEIQKKEQEISQSRERGIELDKEIAELKISLSTTTDVGSFKFIADALHTNVDTAVQYFIFALISVFDPLAVALVLAWNKLVEQCAEKKEESSSKEYTVPQKVPQQIHNNNVLQSFEELPSFQKPSVAPTEPPKTTITAEHLRSLEPATDIVSNVPIAEISHVDDFENDPNFQSLSEEQKAIIRDRRLRFSGDNNSVLRIN
jgi:cell division protein FtsL